MHFELFIDCVPKIRELPLPGLPVQLKMAPPERNLEYPINEPPKRAAVYCVFFPNTSKSTSFVLIRRQTYPGIHSNQMGFPGGKKDKKDSDLHTTALREFKEELGVEKIHSICPLSPLYIPPSNFWVQPFLGYLTQTPKFIPDYKEVAEVVEVSLNEFIQAKVLGTPPGYMLSNHHVWGATAMILAEIKEMLKVL